MNPLAELAGESPVMDAVRDQVRCLLVRRETGRRLPSILDARRSKPGVFQAAVRGRDVLLLAERFLARTCADYGLPSKRLTPGATTRLLEYA